MTKPTWPLISLCLCILALATPASSMAEQPNVVIFIADDMAWNDCGAYGHPNIRTPHIDSLARDGLRSDRFPGEENLTPDGFDRTTGKRIVSGAHPGLSK